MARASSCSSTEFLLHALAAFLLPKITRFRPVFVARWQKNNLPPRGFTGSIAQLLPCRNVQGDLVKAQSQSTILPGLSPTRAGHK
jgi:hypothetical protein